jgi:addiction module RelE/StbE family toxin
VDFKVVITQAALNDLEENVAYIGRESPRAAQRLANDLLNRAQSLATAPRKGQMLQARPGVRRLIRQPYLIIYRIDEEASRIDVLRFWHHARDPKSLDDI